VIAEITAIPPACEEESLSIHKITDHRPSGITRGFTLVELKKPAQGDPESAPQGADAAKE
jgi:hypothetical protein